MPIRIVREGINSSARINALSRGAELFYRRLMSVVDDYGRFHGSPATLRGACWPTCPENVTEDEVKQWMEECLQVHSKCLAGATPLIFLYEANGFRYLQLTDFRQQTRSESKFPDPANQLHSNCDQNEQPRRRRNSETKYEDGDVKREDSQFTGTQKRAPTQRNLDFFESVWERWKRQRKGQGFQTVIQAVIGADQFDWTKFNQRAEMYLRHCEEMSPPWKYASLSLWDWIEGGMILPPEAENPKPAKTAQKYTPPPKYYWTPDLNAQAESLQGAAQDEFVRKTQAWINEMNSSPSGEAAA